MSLPIHAFHPSSHTLDGDISNIYKTFLRDLDLHQEQVQAQKIQSVTVCEVRVILIRMYAEVNTISSFVAFYLVQYLSFFNNLLDQNRKVANFKKRFGEGLRFAMVMKEFFNSRSRLEAELPSCKHSVGRN